MSPNGNGKVANGDSHRRSQGMAQIVHVKRWREGTGQTDRAKLQSGEKVRSAAEMSNEVEDGPMWRDGMKEGMRQAGARVILVNGTQIVAQIGAGEI